MLQVRPTHDARDVVRVLVVDDDRLIHDDYARSLTAPLREAETLRSARDELFGATESPFRDDHPSCLLEHAYSGEAAERAVVRGLAADIRYAVAFVDMRMPPGWSGVETIKALWRLDPAIQVVLCTAYSDFTWDKVLAGVGRSEGLHLLRKPFAGEQVRRFAEVLSRKWQLAQVGRERTGPVSPR